MRYPHFPAIDRQDLGGVLRGCCFFRHKLSVRPILAARFGIGRSMVRPALLGQLADHDVAGVDVFQRIQHPLAIRRGGEASRSFE